MSLRPKALNFDEVWGRLMETCVRVLTLRKVEKSVWNDRFTDVYALCVAYPDPHSERLYNHMKKFFEGHVKTIYDLIRFFDQSTLLEVYHRYWTDYSTGAYYLNHLFMYLNNQFVKKMKVYSADLLYGNPTDAPELILEIGELALDAWKKGLIDPLRQNLSRLLLEAIDADRLGRYCPVRESIICDIIHSFVRVESEEKPVLELYRDVFETPFLARTAEYYAQEGSTMLQQLSISDYMAKVTVMIADETTRAYKFLHHVSHAKVTEECQQHLVGAHLQVFHAECPSMIRNDRRKDLTSLYNLLKPLRGALTPVAQDLRVHIEQEGLEAVKGLQGDGVPGSFVENLLEVHEKYSSMIRQVFSSDQIFLGALDKAFGNVINHKPQPKAPCRSPELLSRYCDFLLKKSTKSSAVSSSVATGGSLSPNSPSAPGNGGSASSNQLILNTETEIEEKLSKSIILFKYLDDKDVFQKFYSKMMAKRLIHQLSISMDMEEAMINKFKQVCGYEFTNKLHRMFTDMSLSTDHNTKFAEFLRDKRSTDLGVGFHIYVLQAGAWPMSTSNLSSFALPPELNRCVHLFEDYYQSRFNGRKLSWLFNLANGELKLNYLKRPYVVTMGTYQMALMLQFERGPRLTREQLRSETLLNDEQFERQLMSLVEAKLLHATGEPTDPNSVIILNEDYSNKRTRFKITIVTQKETPQEVEQTRSSVEEDRKLYLQAAIVRIMKSRKVLKHNALIEEVINYAKGRFSPSIAMIKKCTETLIEKQYIERCADSADTYSYIA